MSDLINLYDYILILPFEDTINEKLHSAFTVKLGNRKGIIIEGEHARDLLVLYSLYAFTDKLIVGSFDLPHGSKLRNLLDSGIATEDELINGVILGAM